MLLHLEYYLIITIKMLNVLIDEDNDIQHTPREQKLKNFVITSIIDIIMDYFTFVYCFIFFQLLYSLSSNDR